jgi:hypothetical protein
MNSLDILPVKPPEIKKSKQHRELPESIPDVYKGQLLLVVGAIRSGKSTLLNSLLLRKSFYNDLFDSMTICSPTIKNDQTSRFLYEKYKGSCFTHYEDEIVDNVVAKQLEKIENKEPTSYCMVLDDFLGQTSKTGRKNNKISFHACRFRHYVEPGDPCMIILSTQKFKELSPLIRANATGVLISGNVKNRKELDALMDEYADAYGGRTSFMKMFKYVAKEPYNWLYLQLDTGRAYKNFTEQLYPNNQKKQDSDSEYEEEEQDEDEIKNIK